MAIYVNMTDKFMSGWGQCPNGKSIYCVECDEWWQAEMIERAAHDRPEMKYISRASKPRRGGLGDHVEITHFNNMGGPWLAYARNFQPDWKPTSES